MANMPDFLLIGAARSGTTAIHAYLRQCPEIFMPDSKEPNFFAYEGCNLQVRGPGADFINNSITDLAAYQALFAKAPEGRLLGEASPLYLFEERAPGRIHHHVPNARMIVILRNPVDQAYSHFLYATKLAIETEPDFTTALSLEEQRLAKGWQPLFGYSRFPRYGEQLARYLKLFPREQFMIRRYEDLIDDPQTLMRDMAAFIGVKTPFEPDMTRRLNAGGVPRNRAIQDFLMKPNPITGAVGLVVPQKARLRIRDWLASFNMQQGDGMPAQARAILRDRLADDVAALSELLDDDYSGWLR